ncbi:heavy-metal-associated domain-containing protein [Faecalicatena contorta]|uniref:heavy-metal-associated domain-containing protein n=1 Tax=Faecalicatena contorta TaxID=39482 RepID=UPI00196102A3|nr:heavy-metal-associated domain-containing protein [Faecalicatena contorta]MBM6685000.1 heavy-metal-associated domain-containing protein [Faecalicatena contorta]MBM6710528.1 heavy-metal-associated domain-containing protein [Faecalicatena contorta]
MADIIALIVIAAIVAAAVAYIVKAKRSGVKCIGCPAGGSCPSGGKAPKKKLDGPVIGRRTLKISGMHCQHCAMAVTQALNRIDGVRAEVDPVKGRARIAFDRQVSEDILKNAVEKAGYHVTGIS